MQLFFQIFSSRRMAGSALVGAVASYRTVQNPLTQGVVA